MKVFRKIAWSMLFTLCIVGFVACSDDDNNDDGGEVITPTTKQLKSVSDMTMSYQDGLLTKIVTEDGKKLIFDYGTQTKSNTQLRSNGTGITTISLYDDNDNLEHYFYDIVTESNGFIKSCKEITYDEIDGEQTETWKFEYNTDGQLLSMKRSEGGNEITTIKYENGNITEVTMTSDEEDNSLYTKIFYTSNEITTAIDNKSSIMFFDMTFGIDIDEMKYAYWAGLLGNATKSLPLKIIYIENSEYEETETFQWTIKDDYVQKMIQTASWGTEEHLFTWE